MTIYVDDDATPYRSVCFILTRFGRDWYSGSGVLVGRNDVLTAGHVIYDATYGLADEIRVYPSYDAAGGGNSYVTPVDEFYLTGFDPDGDGWLYIGDRTRDSIITGSECDIALLTLGVALGDDYGWMTIDYSFDSGVANVTGHPGAYGTYMVSDSGFVYADSIDSVIITSALEINPGNSGGPIWYGDITDPQVIGIVSTGSWAVELGGHSYLAGLITGNDGMLSAPPVSLSITPSTLRASEGQTITFDIQATGVPAGTSYAYTITGVSRADIVENLTGTLTVDGAGRASTSITVIADRLTEGAETVVFALGGASARVVVDDTSRAPTGAFTLRALSESVDEGSTAVFRLRGIDVPSGVEYVYTFSGITTADIAGGLLSGKVILDENGQADIRITLKDDELAEGAEVLTLSVAGRSSSMVVNDTSYLPRPVISIASIAEAVFEGETISFVVGTQNVLVGSSLRYHITGISADDVEGGILSGDVLIREDRRGHIEAHVHADHLTEGDETLVLTIGDAIARVVIREQIIAPTYRVTAATDVVDEGGAAVFLIESSHARAGSRVGYTLSGLSAADISDGVLAGEVEIDQDGRATITVQLARDALTEGDETLVLSVAEASSSILVRDTSREVIVTPTYRVTAETGVVDEGGSAVFLVESSHAPAGSRVGYTLAGLSVADISDGVLAGEVEIDQDGRAAITVQLARDALTEGDETLVLSVAEAYSSILVRDISLAAPTLTFLNALYVVMYDRTADFNGVTYWLGQAGGTGAAANPVTVSAAHGYSRSFLNAQPEYFSTQYASLNDDDFILQLYVNLGGNAAGVVEAAVGYWRAQLMSLSGDRGAFVGEFTKAFLDYAGDDFNGLMRQATLNNKVTVSQAWVHASQDAAFMNARATTDAAFFTQIAILDRVDATVNSLQEALGEVWSIARSGSIPMVNAFIPFEAHLISTVGVVALTIDEAL